VGSSSEVTRQSASQQQKIQEKKLKNSTKPWKIST
jgi:hypothetical protein